VKRFAVLIHPGATADIREAYRYMVERSADGAERWHAGLVAFVGSLETFPHSHPLAPEEDDLRAGVRQALYIRPGSTYRLLYVVEGDCVHVIAVRHGARRWLDPGELRGLVGGIEGGPVG
jgi:plasmid stabilization system protein ParE